MTQNLPVPTDLPDPFVPVGTDLRDLRMMFLDIGALQNSETWTLADGWQAKAAMNLWMRAWHQIPAGSLPNDERLLERWAGVPVPWADVREVAMRGFVRCSDGRLYHRVICTQVIEVINAADHVHVHDRSGDRGVHSELAQSLRCKEGRKLVRKKERKGQPEFDHLITGDQSAPALVGGQIADDWPRDYQEQFWARYPLRVAKARAMAALEKARKRVGWVRLLDRLEAYKAWLAESGPGKWRPEAKHPATWLNGDCWDDDYGPPPAAAAAQREASEATAAALGRADWERVARIYQTTNQWPGPGPAPGKPGCVAPADLFRPPGPGG